MGLFSGSKTTTTNSEPWKPQGDALKNIFAKAGDIYSQSAGTPWYQGDLYANMDPATADAIRRNLSFIQGQGARNADTLNKTGAKIIDGASAGFDGAMSQFMAAASADPTKANIAAAGSYADNPYMAGMVDAASRDVRRNLYEDTLPGIDRAATGSGNINSSRAGVAAGIAQRGAQDMIGDISANLRGQAYSQGLNLAESARTANMGALAQGAGLYGQNLNTGMNALTTGNNMAITNEGAAIDSSQLFQKDRQGQMDADFAQWQGQDTRQMDLLNRYYSILGANNWGGTQTSKEKSSGSILGQILGAASTAAAFMPSDRRLKTNIVKVGELEDGLGVYDYEYLWGDKMRGVMADEVEELRPWALGPTIMGFKSVNYAAL